MGLLNFFNRLSTNSDLMQGMFSRLGMRGWFAEHAGGPETLRNAALRCGSCRESEACADWMDTHDAAAHAPSFCRNRELIEQIRREISSDASASRTPS